MPRKGLFVIGELNVDLILNQINGFPKIGTETVAREMVLTLGSSSAILAANAAAISVPTAFCGVVGKDEYGKMVIRDLENRGVDTTYIRFSHSHSTGITVVMNYGQESANLTYCGAMETLTIEDIPWSSIGAYQHLHLSNFFLQKGIQPHITEVFRRAKSLGLTTSLDLQWDASNQWAFDFRECLPLVDVFMPNEAELLAVSQCNDLEAAIDHLRPYYRTLIVKMGRRGSLGIRGDERISVGAFRAPKFIDSVGAGDSFNAGFLKKYLARAPLRECLEYGNLMGALNTTAAGGTAAFKCIRQIERTIQSIFN